MMPRTEHSGNQELGSLTLPSGKKTKMEEDKMPRMFLFPHIIIMVDNTLGNSK